MVAVVEQAARLLAQLIGIALLGGTLAAAVAAVYRLYVDEIVPGGLGLLVGLAGVAIYLNTTTALGQVIGGSVTPTETEAALFNIAAFAVGVGGAGAGRHLGDRFATEIAETVGGRAEEDVGRLVRTVGRVITVELPEEIDDVVGYDPVSDATRESLAGKTFVFPRGLTVAELRERLVARLTTDYAVGHVDVELTAGGTVEHLGLGSRAAGIGPTLPPATNAVAIHADPAFAASTGDIVQIWETDPMRRVATAELRGVADDVATVAIDAADTPKLDPATQYRLVTLPVEDRPDREFASLLRAADETFASVTVAAGSPLHGIPVGGLDLTVVAIKPEGAEPVPIPPRNRQLDPGDVVFAIAAPETLRRLDGAARPLDPSLASDGTEGSPEAKPSESDTTTGSGDEPDGDGGPDGDSGPDDVGPMIEIEQDADDSVDGTAEADDLDEISFEDDSEDLSFEDDPDEVLDDLPVGDKDDEGSVGDDNDDLDDLEPLSLGDDGDGESETDVDEGTEGEEDADEGSDESSEDGDSGGSKSFQELKEEFESGDADWDEDIDESPGGDMRLDE